MSDKLIRAMADQGRVRALVVISTDVVEEARRRHDCFPVATAALGRTLSAALLLGATLKECERLTLRIVGDGPLGGIIVDTDGQGNVRGYVRNPQIDLPFKNGKLDVGGAVGKGFVYLTRDMGFKEPYTGTAPLVSGEIAEDITNYLFTSEQIPSTCALGVLVNPDYSVQAAGGFLVQALPGATEETLARLETNLLSMPPISTLVYSGKTVDHILALLFSGMPWHVLTEEGVLYNCSCSKQRLADAFICSGERELQEMQEDGQAEARCHFCNETYHFTKDDLQEIAEKITASE